MALLSGQAAACLHKHSSGLDSTRSRPRRALCQRIVAASAGGKEPVAPTCSRRTALLLPAAAAAATVVQGGGAQLAEASEGSAGGFMELPSGLLIQDIKVGTGRKPQPGDTVVLHWAGRTKNYQAKRIDNTSLRDEPYRFVLGAHTAIPAFEEAVAGMRAGGLRRVEVPGEKPQLSYPRNRKERFEGGFRYRYGPQPKELGGQRALDFVLDNETLAPTNRTLLFDIKLLSIYSPSAAS